MTLDLAKNIANMQEDFIVVFKGEEIILTNSSFNKFFGVSSTEEYNRNFGTFVDNFVPHPSYFNAQKINENELWFESIMKLDELNRVVSILSQEHEPHAYSVSINEDLGELRIVTFKDITQTLIKRIMIENNANIDKKTGAYTKQYFLQVDKSYEEAAVFNEKIIALAFVDISDNEMNSDDIKTFVLNFKSYIRQDDMLIKWSESKFLLAFLVDDIQKTQAVIEKLQNSFKKLNNFNYTLKSIHQTGDETIQKLIKNLADT
ncbi:MAG: hypothetical protein Q9M34_05900 [Sulfurimonas sp.]|nr:hypothetical protein [Sulfurimonas sp.]